MCSCANGYVLLDRTHCGAPNGTDLRLLFAHDQNVWSFDQHGGDLKLLANATQASGLDYHYGKNYLFWSDTKTRKVKKTVFKEGSYRYY